MVPPVVAVELSRTALNVGSVIGATVGERLSTAVLSVQSTSSSVPSLSQSIVSAREESSCFTPVSTALSAGVLPVSVSEGIE